MVGIVRLRYVDERLATFHEDILGYPSISACHAIGYLTTRGIYGYHNLGGESSDRWGQAPTKFGDFYRANCQPGEAGLGFYGCAHVTGQRGYKGPDKVEAWKTELAAFASGVGWTGSIWGVDLTGLDQGGYDNTKSAYVEFRKIGVKCLIYARQWRDKEAVKTAPDARFTAIAVSKVYPTVTTSLTAGGGTLFNLDPVKLR